MAMSILDMRSFKSLSKGPLCNRNRINCEVCAALNKELPALEKGWHFLAVSALFKFIGFQAKFIGFQVYWLIGFQVYWLPFSSLLASK